MAPSAAQYDTGLLSFYFSPLPKHEHPVSPFQRPLDHVENYLKTTDGVWDLFRVFEQVSCYLSQIPFSDAKTDGLFSKITGVFNSAGAALSIPAIFTSAIDLKRSLSSLIESHELPYVDPLRSKKIALATKQSVVDGVSLGNAVSLAVLFYDKAVTPLSSWVSQGADYVFNATSLIDDGIELIEESVKLRECSSDDRNDAEKAKMEDEKWLSMMKIAKDVVSIAATLIAVMGSCFAVLAGNYAIGAVVLGLGTVWLIIKLTSVFYQKVIEERHSHPPVNGFT